MLKFQMGLIVLFIACVALISCESIQDMMTMPDDTMPDDTMMDDTMTDDTMTDDTMMDDTMAGRHYDGC